MNGKSLDPLKFNSLVSHPLQSFEWGSFREKTGIKVIRKILNNKKAFQMTIHKVPFLKTSIGYLPKGDMLSKDLLDELKQTGKENGITFVQLEPNVQAISNFKFQISNLGLHPSFHPLFTKYTFVLDLTNSEDELLKNMHQKTRYNIRVAQRNGVTVSQESSNKAFEAYLNLTSETTRRQKFYAHDRDYHLKMWETLGGQEFNPEKLQAHLLLARYKEKALTAWVLLTFKDTLYYPYGASSTQHREVMASNLLMWEAIKFGKKLGLKRFDMWGALGPNPDPKDPWFGFHRFKEGYGPKLVEFEGSFDLVINEASYKALDLADKARWAYLRLRKII